jgi:peptidoglycan lytic transglycosylase G
MAPAAGNWLYFVAIDKQGNSVFTNDYQQHLKNINQACKNGVPLC